MKKLIALFVFIICLFFYSSKIIALMGDIDGDGIVSQKDYNYVNDYITKKINTADKIKVEEKGDLNHDGIISTKDLSEMQSIVETGSSITGVSYAQSCAEFHNADSCNKGKSEYGNFGCVWNKKYEFCSPTGLTYLSCGSDKTDAHDIPEMLPRLVSYFIVILKTATPIILIIMGMVQLVKAIAGSNEDDIKKAKGSLIKKLIAAVLVFFSISIVQFVVDQVVDDDESGSVAACMDCFINNNCSGVTYYTDGYGKCYNAKTKSEVGCNTDIGKTISNFNSNSGSSSNNSNSSSGKSSDSHGSSGAF